MSNSYPLEVVDRGSVDDISNVLSIYFLYN